ncbi:deoxyribodipyrimidine photolyase [Gracilaria domingensis]|nr:deoxyribodipyrimidine photolyase [Gracilaria domingensis]
MRRLTAARAQNNHSADSVSFLSDVTVPPASSSHHQKSNASYYTATSPASDDDDVEQQAWGPLSPNGGFALGRVQRWYLHHSLRVLRQQLEKLSITLVLRRVDCAEDTAVQVLSVARAIGAARVFWNKRYKPRAYPVDEAVKYGLARIKVIAQDFDSETLIAPSADHGTFHDFQSYARFWLNRTRVSPPSQPNAPIHPSDVTAFPRPVVQSLLISSTKGHPSHKRMALSGLPTVSDLELLDGLSISGNDSPGEVSSIGCVAANRTLERFLRSDRFSRFASNNARRDGMVTGEDIATSRLSPHIRFGEISPRVLFWSVLDAGCQAAAVQDSSGLRAARQFVKNMSLREFGYYMLNRYPSAACRPIIPEFDVFPWEEDADGSLTQAWKTGTTGFPIVDAAMRQLIREGWLHNRMRFLAASFFCKYLLLPWPVGAAHMVRTLVDGDEACNSLGWQWTAGCNSDSFPFSTLVNPLSLHTHTQSQSRAAQYIRKYVPELAHLPDRLIFTPWAASDAERARYRLRFVPLRQYNEICPSPVFSRVASDNKEVFYPIRVVTGPRARYRARTAMEVMRKIFIAKKRCAPLLKDYTSPWPNDTFVNKKLEGTGVTIIELEDCEDLPESSTESEVSYVTTSYMPNSTPKQALVRQRPEPDTTLNALPSKRLRISSPPERSQAQEPVRRSQGPFPKNLSLSRRQQPAGQSEMSGRQQWETPTHLEAQGQTTQSNRKVVDVISDQRTKEIMTASRMKRPRSPSQQPTHPLSTPRISDTCESVTPSLPDDRLSVRSLLSPNLASPPLHSVRLSSPRKGKHVAAEMMSAMSGLPKLAQVAASQRDAQLSQNADGSRGALGLTGFPPPSPSPRISSTGKQFVDGDLVCSPKPARKTHTLLNRPNRSHPSENISNVGPHRGLRQTNHSVPNPDGHATLPVQAPNHDREGDANPPKVMRVVPSHPQPSLDGNQHPNIHRNDGVHNATFSPSGTGPPPMFHPNAIPMTLMGAQFTSTQNQAAHMMMPFPHAGGHIPMQALPHHPGSIPGQNTQGYVNMSHVGATHPHAQGSPFTWYPTVTPYVEFRPPTVPGAMLPHMAHPYMHGGHNQMATPYHVDRRNLTPRAAPPCVPGPTSSANKPLERSQRRGPSTPMQREGIARRMAAMDYTDETYGGKHWEQWQAISLHLLNQYEFSEDTDRDTTRAYVRLCVLKDELRDANPNGPRVTVNHCKEVFRILNLPVTGEWDRRGHGGVRGPYVYGCMKRSSHHVSR